MSTDYEKHKEYLSKGDYPLRCQTKIFTPEEIEIIKRLGYWLEGLINGELKPITKAQQNFIAVMIEQIPPTTNEEVAWFKYINRCRIEKKLGDKLNVSYKAEDSSFFSRDDYYKLQSYKKNRRLTCPDISLHK
jgi:uncharacterized protein YifE (UPF0438 family)